MAQIFATKLVEVVSNFLLFQQTSNKSQRKKQAEHARNKLLPWLEKRAKTVIQFEIYERTENFSTA